MFCTYYQELQISLQKILSIKNKALQRGIVTENKSTKNK